MQVADERLLAHVRNNGLGGVIGTLFLIVFEQGLKDSAKHFGVHADFDVDRIGLINGEVKPGEESEELLEELGREVERAERFLGRVFLKQAAVQIGNTHGLRTCGLEKVLGTAGVQRFVEERDEAGGVIAFRFRTGLKPVVQEISIAIGPSGRGGWRTTDPMLLLEKMKENESGQQAFGKVAGVAGGFGIGLPIPGTGKPGSMFGKGCVMADVFGEEGVGEFFNRKGGFEIGEGGETAGGLVLQRGKAFGGGAAGFGRAKEVGEAAGGSFAAGGGAGG